MVLGSIKQLLNSLNYSNVLLIIVALAPCILFLIYFHKKDRVEKEPFGLIFLLLFGGFLATIVAVIAEVSFEKILYLFFDYPNNLYYFIDAFICVGFVEETAKFIFLNAFSWRNRNFNCSFDGLLYSVCVSIGFAAVENILYSVSSGMETALTRAVTSIPGHVAFSVLMGLFYSFARKAENRGEHGKTKTFKWIGLILATLAHGLFDYCLMSGDDLLIIIWMVLLVVLYLLIFIATQRMSRKDRHITY